MSSADDQAPTPVRVYRSSRVEGMYLLIPQAPPDAVGKGRPLQGKRAGQFLGEHTVEQVEAVLAELGDVLGR